MTQGRSGEFRETELLIGQLERVFPELVSRNEDGEVFVFVGGVLMALVRAVRELEDRLGLIEERVTSGDWLVEGRIVAVDGTAIEQIRQLRGVTWEWRDDVR